MLYGVAGLLVATGCRQTAEIELTDTQNYWFLSTISADAQPIAPGEDATVDWSALTTDLLGEALDPAVDVDEVRLIQFAALTQPEVLDGINTDSLSQSDLSGFASTFPEDGTESGPLVQKADTALYKAKETGRNRVCLAGPELEKKV